MISPAEGLYVFTGRYELQLRAAVRARVAGRPQADGGHGPDAIRRELRRLRSASALAGFGCAGDTDDWHPPVHLRSDVMILDGFAVRPPPTPRAWLPALVAWAVAVGALAACALASGSRSGG